MDNNLNSVLKKEDVVHSSDYKDLKTEAVHIIGLVVLAVIAFIGIKSTLASSSPTAKAKAVIITCIVIAAVVFFTMYITGDLGAFLDGIHLP